jgi:hypothetical protein
MSRTIEYEHFECANCHATLGALKPVIHEEMPKCSKCLKHWWVPASLKWIDANKTEGKYIDFRLHGISVTGKTKLWVVQNRDNGTVLGKISWFGRWRKYVFEPWADMVFEETCMRDISQFIQQETTYQRKAAARRKAAGA